MRLILNIRLLVANQTQSLKSFSNYVNLRNKVWPHHSLQHCGHWMAVWGIYSAQPSESPLIWRTTRRWGRLLTDLCGFQVCNIFQNNFDKCFASNLLQIGNRCSLMTHVFMSSKTCIGLRGGVKRKGLPCSQNTSKDYSDHITKIKGIVAT